MQASMRGLPAQFTDIWVSLASGQSPMMVMIVTDWPGLSFGRRFIGGIPIPFV
jgi:hypothetical protein